MVKFTWKRARIPNLFRHSLFWVNSRQAALEDMHRCFLPVKVESQWQDSMAWLDDVIVTKERRLDALIHELLRYHVLLVIYDGEVGKLTVSGMSQLNRQDLAAHALLTIAQTLLIHITRQNDRIVIRKNQRGFSIAIRYRVVSLMINGGLP